MNDDYKHLLVTPQLHSQIKAHAALLGETLLQYVEIALNSRLADSPIARGQGMLLESDENKEAQ